MTHISICICTYRRNKLLKELLIKISTLITNNFFTFSVVVIDNDENHGAKRTLIEMQKTLPVEIRFTHVIDRNLAVVRNTSIELSRGDYIAFIDDDEYPSPHWLLLLYKTIDLYKSSGSLGPVIPQFQVEPPKWIVKGKFSERSRYHTGTELSWKNTRTGNVLIKKGLFLDKKNLFDEKFKLGSEDDNMFKRFIEKGHKFIWCDEAIVYEQVPKERLTILYYLKRSKLFGYISYSYNKDTRSDFVNFFVMLKSVVIIFIYIFLMPLSLLSGIHKFIHLLTRFIFHISLVGTYFKIIKLEERNI